MTAMQRPTPGVNVVKALERLRYEVNRPAKNSLIDDAIEQVEKDYIALSEAVKVLKLIEIQLGHPWAPDKDMQVVMRKAAISAINTIEGVK